MQHLTVGGFPKWIWIERVRHSFLRMMYNPKDIVTWASKAQYVSDDGFVVTATLADAYRLSCDRWRIC